MVKCPCRGAERRLTALGNNQIFPSEKYFGRNVGRRKIDKY